MKHVSSVDMPDFTLCKRVYRELGGSDRKFEVDYNNSAYILKFAEMHAKKSDISTKYVNNVVSEYLGSHIIETTGIPVHETILGTYNNDELVVACRDFRNKGEDNIEFSELIHSVYDSKDIGRLVFLNQYYDTVTNENVLPKDLVQPSIDRFWDTFVMDALIGNFDRHAGNWGYISDGQHIRMAPIYDNGSSLLPQLSDTGMEEIANNSFSLLERCLVFPSPVLCTTKEKVGKVGYYDMLSSGYDNNCTEALKRMMPKIDMNKIYSVIDNTPVISEMRKTFYKTYISYRKEMILDRALERCLSGYDIEALNRINNGKQFSNDLLQEKIQMGLLEPPSLSTLSEYENLNYNKECEGGVYNEYDR